MRCVDCGGEFENVEGPVHAYMLSSPGCWAAYGRVLALEYSNTAYRVLHRLTVDAYAVQHPGVDNTQARNSVGIHLSRLCLLLERGWRMEEANAAMVAITAKKRAYPWLKPPPRKAALTVADVEGASTADDHMDRVRAWARAVWVNWDEHHATVRGWLGGLEKPRV